jgi:trigger factor
MDYKGSLDGQPFEGGEGRDQLVELGSGRLIPGFEEQLVGASAGDERAVSLTFPDDYGAEHLAGKPAEFAVTVREVKTKRLPELGEDFAADAGFDTVDELREDIAKRLREGEERQIEAEYREAVLDSVVDKATIDVPHELVHARAHELWHQTLHSLSHQGISREAYLQIAGKDDEEEIVKEAEPDAERALRREAVLAAIVEAEEIEPSDGDVLDALQGAAAQERTTPEKLRKRLEKSGRIDDLKDDLAQRAALDLLVEAAKPISVEQAKARELLWTPEQGEPGERAGGRLWTPGD